MAANDSFFYLVNWTISYLTSTPIENSRSKRKRKGSVQCLRCNKTINLEMDAYYTCSVCALDVCFRCTGISLAMHNSVREDGSENFMWAC